MKIIQSEKYKEAQLGLGTGQQSNDTKVRELIQQGIDVGMAIRAVYPDLLPVQVEELKTYYGQGV